MTRALLIRPMRMLDEPRASSFITSATLAFDARRAGSVPAIRDDRTVSAITNAMTPGSSEATNHKGISWVARPALKKSMPTFAMTRPTPAPTMARTSVSASSCAMVRDRLAPSAVRIATSLLRDTVRASRRLATFAHAIRSTPNTAPSIV